jgi:3D (Asp-Asp-Asp) domain-containing protein
MTFNFKPLALAAVAVLVGLRSGDCGTLVNSTSPTLSNWTEGQAFSSKHWKNLARPTPEEIVHSLTLYGTYYFTPTLPYSSSGIAIKDVAGKLLGPKLSQNEFCNAGIEGAFNSMSPANGRPQTYNIARGPIDAPTETDCKGAFANVLREHKLGKRPENWPAIITATERSRYRATDAPYGNGGSNRWLIPWRSIATYNRQISPGTIIYIPQIEGLVVTLPSGETVQHDGYFFSADSGTAIKENHIDFFTGLLSPINRSLLLIGIDGDKNPFVANVVNRDDATAYLKGLHRMQ